MEKEVAELLEAGEKILADRLYANHPLFETSMAYDRIYDSVRSKIERVIRDVKCFAMLKNEYRGFNYTDHELKFHIICRLVSFKKTQ